MSHPSKPFEHQVYNKPDDNGNHENGRQKPTQGQWLMQHQQSMKHIMTIITERDAAIQERNLALSEKKAALAERDMAILQRDAAIMERDNAIATLQYRDNAMTMNGATLTSPCPPGCQITRGIKHMHHPHPQPQPHIGRTQYNMRDMHINETIPMSPVAQEPAKSRRIKRTKEAKEGTSAKKAPKSSKKVKREGEDLNKSQEWKSNETLMDDDQNGQLMTCKPDWKDQDLGLNQVVFDDTTMPVPVCSCTGVVRACYKWGNGGWQSSCCTTNMSMYPLPAMPNRRHARIGGRKMSGSAFTKLLSRLSAQGHDLSNPVDLRDNWAKHGTNRYITIK